jgi:hypothetical protein
MRARRLVVIGIALLVTTLVVGVVHVAAQDGAPPVPAPASQLTGLANQCKWLDPANVPGPYPAPATEIAIAGTYLEALVSHDASHILMAPNLCRMENGLNSASSSADIKRGVETPALGGIKAIYDVHWFVEGPEAVAYYTMNATTSIEYIAERFLVVDGVIQEIEANFGTPGFPPGIRPGPSSGCTGCTSQLPY